MKETKSCRRCLYKSDHPLGLVIDGDGICSGCRIHEEKDNLDWNFRLNKIKKITNLYKSKNGFNYDCIVPVTGSGDSYFLIHLVKNILKLNPLVVHYNHYFNTKIGIKNLSNLRTIFDVDILIQNVNPNSVKKITRTTLDNFGSIYWHVIAGQTAFPVQTAITHKIPLILWGANQGLEQVGMFSHKDEVEMTRRYRKEHDLLGFEADDLLSIFDTLSENDIWQYRYPSEKNLLSLGVRNIYLGNFFRWDPKSQHEFVIKTYNYKTMQHNRTFYNYDHTDCFNYMNLHDLIKYLKHGYSKVSDHLCREIRHKRISREEALKVEKYYQTKNPEFLKHFCQWLEIKEEGLRYILNQIKNKFNPNINQIDDFLNKDNFNHRNFINLNEYPSMKFNNTNDIQINHKDAYIIFGKEYP